MGCFRCSPGSDEDVETEAGIRALVPIALSATCKGAVEGALVGIAAAAVVSVLATSFVKFAKKTSWMEAASLTRSPGIILFVWAFLQMGMTVCGARLITAEDTSNVALGVVGVMLGCVLPGVCITVTWAIVSRRCFRLSQRIAAIAGRSPVIVWCRSTFLPSYQLDHAVYPVSRMFATLVSRTRRPSCVWAGLATVQPLVMLLIVFFEGAMCDIILIIGGVLLLLIGIVCHIIFRPHRIVASNYLQGVAMCLSATVLIIASRLVSDPLDVSAGDAYRTVTMIQVVMSVCRFVHLGVAVLYMRLYGSETFELSQPDGTLSASPTTEEQQHQHGAQPAVSPLIPSNPDDSVPPRWVFDIHSRCCFSSHEPAATLLPPLLPLRNSKLNNTQFSEQFIASVVNDTEEGYVPTTDRPTLVEEDNEQAGDSPTTKHPPATLQIGGDSLDDLLELESRGSSSHSGSSLKMPSSDTVSAHDKDYCGGGNAKSASSQLSSLHSSVAQESDIDSDL